MTTHAVQRTLTTGAWNGAALAAIEHADWTPATATAALLALDVKASELMLTVGEDRMMMVGGYGERFVIFIAVDVDRELFTLADPAKSATETEELLIAGVLGSYPSNIVVPRAMASAAITHFHAGGAPAPELHWLRD